MKSQYSGYQPADSQSRKPVIALFFSLSPSLLPLLVSHNTYNIVSTVLLVHHYYSRSTIYDVIDTVALSDFLFSTPASRTRRPGAGKFVNG